MPGTVRLHRVLRAPAEQVYRAFTDPKAMCKWLPPNGYTGEVFEMDPKPGGKWRMAFTELASGGSHSFGGTYLECVPGQRLRYTSLFDDQNLPGEMTTTVTLRKVQGGTEMEAVQEGIPDVIPTEMCYMGWQQSLALLALLLETSHAA